MDSLVQLITLACLLVAWHFITLARKTSKRSKGASEPPVEYGWIPFIGMGLNYILDTKRTLDKMNKKYGDCFTLYMGGQRVTFIMDHASFAGIWKNKDNLTFEGLAEEMLAKATNHRVAPGHYHAMITLERKALNLANVTATARSFQSHLFKVLKSAMPVHPGLYQFTSELFFHSSIKAFYGEVIDPSQLFDDFRKFDKTHWKLSSKAAQTLMMKITNNLLSQVPTLQSGLTPSIFHERLPARALNDFLLIFIGANSNTIAANYWALFFILSDKDAATAVRSELESIKYNSPKLSISETIRMRSSSQSTRLAEKNCEFTLQKTGKVFSVRKGDTVILDGSKDLFDEAVWETPRQFNYKHFLENDVRKLPFSPFGGGISLCPGRILARMEITIFVAEMMREFDVTLENVTKDSFEPDMARFAFGFLEPKNEVKFSLKRRDVEV
ncbi:cytochrome P450 [Rhizoclosmatium globosum]|uniref:Cytochrome P450 n=1 Tax=Rhizoclosmatium globosum TaxID=329046 RepID=A0A1Y2BKV2_9FUNG|nr:cytochrome P450 [Rhizoclosmatium globosum]|eukprot:ORY35250.1 cytochrome P450 [Rhizoclosmatium globosum]